MIYLRTSTIEKYRSILAGEWDEEDDSELVERIKAGQWSGAGPKRWQMDAGTEWHRMLESTKPSVVRYGKGFFPVEPAFQYDGEDVLAARKYIGEGLWEVTGRLQIIPGVIVEGTADWLRGLTIQDNKTCFSTPDCRNYERSIQWRMYCLIHEAKVFRYNLWDASDPKEGRISIRGVVSCNFFPYPDMLRECQAWVKRLVDWADSKSLIPYLEKDRAKPSHRQD